MPDAHQPIKLENHWEIECLRLDHQRLGNVRLFKRLGLFQKQHLAWREAFDNLVVTAGLNDILTKYFKGSSYTAAWYVGLVSATPTVDAADTMASHAGWTEVQSQYSQSTRPALTLGTPSGGSVSNSASKAQFSLTGGVTVGGAFVSSVATKNDGTGTLYGAGAFAEGNRALVSGDTLNVQVTLTATAS